MNRILVVDDEEWIRAYVRKTIESYGKIKVIEAEDGKTALKAARRHKPDLVFLDRMMPDMDGLEVLAELKQSEKTQQIPVVMLTGEAAAESVRKAMYWYADQYITKPVKRAELLEVLARFFPS